MRIAMLTNNYKPFIGGVPISIERLSEDLRKLGHEVYIFAPTYEEQQEEANVIRYKTHRFKLKGNMVLPHIVDFSMERVFKALKIDIIHVHHPHFSGWMGTRFGRKYHIPVVYTYHTRYEHYVHHIKGFDYLDKWANAETVHKSRQAVAEWLMHYTTDVLVPAGMKGHIAKCDGVFAPTPLMKEVLQEMGIDKPIRILPTGLGNHFFEKDEAHLAIRERYQLEGKQVLCTVARLAKEKNLAFIIDGMAQLKARRGETFSLLIIGDGPERETLQHQVEQLGLTGEIIFVDAVPNHEMRHYYQASDLFVFASQSETQGIVLLEAMASHLPVVAIKASGVVDVVKDYINGHMTAASINEWVDAIERVLDNQAYCKQLGEGAYETATAYSGERIAVQAAGYYKELIESKRVQQEARSRDVYNYRKTGRKNVLALYPVGSKHE